MPKKAGYKKRKGYKGVTKGARKSAYRPRFISRELQLLNRRPQMLTQKVVHQESFFLRQNQPTGVQSGQLSILQCRAAFPGNPIYWGTQNDPQTYPQSLTKTETTLFSQMGSMYKEAYVVGAKMEAHIKFVGQRPVGAAQASNPSQLENLVAIGIVNGGTTSPGSLPSNLLDVDAFPSEMAEKNNFRVARVMCAGNSTDGTNLQGGTNLRTKDLVMKAYYSPKKLLGIKDVADEHQVRFQIQNKDQALLTNFENPQFVLAIGHNCDNTDNTKPIVRGTHNDCYVTIKTTYIVKCVEPTDARGDNLIITTAGQNILQHTEL